MESCDFLRFWYSYGTWFIRNQLVHRWRYTRRLSQLYRTRNYSRRHSHHAKRLILAKRHGVEILSQELPYHMKKVHRRGAKSVNEWQYQQLREHRPDLPLRLDLAIEKPATPATVNAMMLILSFGLNYKNLMQHSCKAINGGRYSNKTLAAFGK